MQDLSPTSRRLATAIYEALVEHRGGNNVRAITRRILRHVDGGIALIGIDRGGERVVCFDPVDRVVYRIPATPTGVHPARATVEWSPVDAPHPWVAAHGESLAWLHPRYRRAGDAVDDRQLALTPCPGTGWGR